MSSLVFLSSKEKGQEKSTEEVSTHLKALESVIKDKNFFGVDSSRYSGNDQKLKWIRAWNYFSVKHLNEEDFPFLCVQ